MPINKSITISGTVGMFGANNRADVKVVKERLNELMSPTRRKLATDGVYGQQTGLAITQFQRYVCGFQWPDGLVDKNKKTIQLLNDPQSAKKWANSCPISDEQIDQFLRPWNAVTAKTVQAPQKTSATIQRLNAELKELTALVKKKYPKGRPDGLGVLAIYTPGKGTERNLKWASNKVMKVGKEDGAAWGVIAGLGFAAAAPFLVVYGLFEDTVVTYHELFFQPEVHGKPTEYDKLVREVQSLKREIEKLDAER